MFDAILFDLDGTLLPMDTDEFVKGYLGLLAKTASKWGYDDSEALVKSLWAGVGAMMKNDGAQTNFDAFWKAFSLTMGRDCSGDIPKFDEFYRNEFMMLSSFATANPLAKEAVRAAREKAKYVILASQPMFPGVATEMRLSWTGISGEDFDWITQYSNSRFCKPSTEYYKDILERFSLDPSKCLMIGNDVGEDIVPTSSLGISGYLVTDYLINRKDEGITCPSGTYADMVNYIKKL